MPGSPLPATVAACLQRHVGPDDRLLLGLSGGIDSVVLLKLLAGKVPVGRLAALHVNHGISPFAQEWEHFSLSLCKQLDIPCTSVRVDVERGSADGLEAAARRARHAVFAAAACDWVVLAHHRDDQAETLLFNLLRGCGTAGAAAMRASSGRLLRPLLSVGRGEIETYARQQGLTWCDDESNCDEKHARNFLRQSIFPALKGRFPAAAENFAKAAGRFAEANDLLDALARTDLGADQTTFPISVASLAALDEVRARNVLRYLLSSSDVQIPSERRLRESLRQMLEAGADRHPSVVLGRHRLFRRRGHLYLEPLAPLPESS